MSAPSFAEALDAYAHAIACCAPSIEQASRFADLTTAHRARMIELHEAEEAVNQVSDRLLPCLDAPDEWATINGMPGTCCKTCGMPTESEPCEQHQAAAYARCNR